MNRIPHRSDFRIRLAFSDADRLPVSMAGVDIDLWFSTRPGAPVFFAGCRSGVCNSCEILDDGSLLVMFDDHRLAPGQISADFAIHSDDESMPDGKRDIHIKPPIPIELTDSTCSRPSRPGIPQKDTGQPILVNVTIPISRPNLSHHVTRDELQKALKGMAATLDVPKIAGDDEISPIISIFSATDSPDAQQTTLNH